MPAPNGPQWYNLWQSKIDAFKHGDLSEDPKLKEKEIKDNPSSYMSRVNLANSPSEFSEWASTPFFGRAEFPTTALQSMDKTLEHSDNLWDSNPMVRKRQKAFKRPKGAPESWEIDSSHPDFLHEQMKGTGVPEHVTVYHHGDIPEGAEYASGSVDPNWSEAVKTGWRSKDPSINRGRLHIYLVPHEDILATAGVEKEVFFRRGQPLRKTPRTNKQQKRAEVRAEDEF